MNITDEIVEGLNYIIKNKKILEVACGDSNFSLSASKYAAEILATDISLERFNRRNILEVPINLKFVEMDAKKLKLNDKEFDIAVCYNAVGHLAGIIDSVLSEMERVTTKDGKIIFISTWLMDKKMLEDIKKIYSRKFGIKNIQFIQKSKYNILIIQKFSGL